MVTYDWSSYSWLSQCPYDHMIKIQAWQPAYIYKDCSIQGHNCHLTFHAGFWQSQWGLQIHLTASVIHLTTLTKSMEKPNSHNDYSDSLNNHSKKKTIKLGTTPLTIASLSEGSLGSNVVVSRGLSCYLLKVNKTFKHISKYLKNKNRHLLTMVGGFLIYFLIVMLSQGFSCSEESVVECNLAFSVNLLTRKRINPGGKIIPQSSLPIS